MVGIFSDNFNALLDKDSEVDQGLVCRSAHLVILEVNISSELGDGFIYDIVSIIVGLRGGSLSLSLNWKNGDAASNGVLRLLIEG